MLWLLYQIIFDKVADFVKFPQKYCWKIHQYFVKRKWNPCKLKVKVKTKSDFGLKDLKADLASVAPSLFCRVDTWRRTSTAPCQGSWARQRAIGATILTGSRRESERAPHLPGSCPPSRAKQTTLSVSSRAPSHHRKAFLPFPWWSVCWICCDHH